MDVYTLEIKSKETETKYFRYFEFNNFVDKNGSVVTQTFRPIWDDIENYIHVDCSMKIRKSEREVIPDYIYISRGGAGGYYGMSEDLKRVFDDLGVKYRHIPITYDKNASKNYYLFEFCEYGEHLIDLEKSNAVLDNNGIAITKVKGLQPYSYNIVLVKKAEEVNGIFRLKERPRLFICNQEVKKYLLNSGLVGFSFHKQIVSLNNEQ